jgi:hypothetical protein
VNDAALVVIAVAMFAIAIVQVCMFVWAIRTARRVGDAVARLEQDVRPVVTNLQSVMADAARAAAVAASQVDKADQMLGAMRQSIDSTVQSLQEALLSPVRDALSLFQALREVIFGASRRPPSGDSRRRQAGEEEDALFIG